MNKAKIKQLDKRLNNILSKDKDKDVIRFTLLGGLSEGKPYREITKEEGEILRHKRLPIPISIALDREKEFLEMVYGKEKANEM